MTSDFMAGALVGMAIAGFMLGWIAHALMEHVRLVAREKHIQSSGPSRTQEVCHFEIGGDLGTRPSETIPEEATNFVPGETRQIAVARERMAQPWPITRLTERPEAPLL
jgi:hypothetical protein